MNDSNPTTAQAATSQRTVTQLRNGDGGTYFIVVDCGSREANGEFVRGLWQSMPDDLHGCPADAEDACGEWTDRIRGYRTTVNYEGACIRTHAWSPSDDKQTLHADVLAYLKRSGVSV